MRSGTQILRNLALLGVLLGSIGGFGSWESTDAGAQQQPQPSAPCSQRDRDQVDVETAQELRDAVADLKCRVIRILSGEYKVNLLISEREDLTIKAVEPCRIEDVESCKVTIRGTGKDRQTIYIANSNKITIEGLKITSDQGNIGIFVSEKSGRTGSIKLESNFISGYPEAGIKITGESTVELLKNYIFDNKTIDKQGVGVIIEGASTVHLSNNKIRGNGDDGVRIINSTVTLEQNEIVKNRGCGVKAQEGRIDPEREPSNIILKNTGGNTCPWQLARSIRKREIPVPYGILGETIIDKLQEAIYEAEPVRGEEDTPYTVRIQQGKDTYTENLCIDRSVKIQVDHKVRILSGPEKPAIAIGSKDCLLHKEEKGNVDMEAGDTLPSIRIHIQGRSNFTISPLDIDTSKGVGFQIETLHQDSAQKTFLKVTLEDVTVENYKTGAGIRIRPTAKNHKLTVDIKGTNTLQDTDCTSLEYPRFLRGEVDFTPARTSIQNNQVGIWIDNPQQADLRVTVKDVEIKGNSGEGILYKGSGNSTLTIERSRAVENGKGIVAGSQGPDANVDRLTVTLGRIWQNRMGGVQLNPDPRDNARSKLQADLINVDIRKNGGFGVHIQGNVEVLLKAISDIPISQERQAHNCEISDNFGTGIRAHGSAVVTIENMFVSGNGYQDEGKTLPVPRLSEPKVGPDGIFASDSVKLTVQNTYVGPNNAGVGIALQASNKGDTLKATLNDNYIESNRKWGISYIKRSCLDERTMPDDFYGKVEGQDNVLVANGLRLRPSELAGGPDIGLGHGQVCPKELDSLIKRVQ